jgi:hypothetical protein
MLIAARHAAQRPRSASQLSTGMLWRGRIAVPHPGQRESGLKRL